MFVSVLQYVTMSEVKLDKLHMIVRVSASERLIDQMK